MWRGLAVSLCCVLLLGCLCSAEIHRAKALKTKLGASRSLNRNSNSQSLHLKESGSEDLIWGHSTETWTYSIVSAILVGLSGIFPLMVIPLETGKALRRGAGAAQLSLMLSFAVGGLLGDVFLHLLPEAWNSVNTDGHDHSGHMTIGLWVMVGILTFLIIEKIFPDHDDDHSEKGVEEEEEQEAENQTIPVNGSPNGKLISNGTTPKKRRSQEVKQTSEKNGYQNGRHQNGRVSNGTIANGHANGHAGGSKGTGQGSKGSKRTIQDDESMEHIKTSGWLNLLANVVDNFTHGLAVAGSYSVSTKTGVLTTIAVLLHEIPHEIGDFAILLRAGFDRWRAAKAQLLTASGGLLGALAALCAESAKSAGDKTAWVLPFTSGGFIYIAMVTVVPDLLKEKNPWNSAKQVFLLVLGVAVMAMVTLMFDEGCHGD